MQIRGNENYWFAQCIGTNPPLNKKLFRDRVVNKERCTTLDHRKLSCQTKTETR